MITGSPTMRAVVSSVARASPPPCRSSHVVPNGGVPKPARSATIAAAVRSPPLRAYLSSLRQSTPAAPSDASATGDLFSFLTKTSTPAAFDVRCRATHDSGKDAAVGTRTEDDNEHIVDAAGQDDSATTWSYDDYAKKLPRVIYEDEDILAIDKPWGMAFHSSDTAPGVMATVKALQSLDQLPGSEYDGPLHAVHSLDEVASGVRGREGGGGFRSTMTHWESPLPPRHQGASTQLNSCQRKNVSSRRKQRQRRTFSLFFFFLFFFGLLMTCRPRACSSALA